MKVLLALNKDCVNGHGRMTPLKNPALVFVGADVAMYCENLYDFSEADQEVPWARLIVRICVECGYYESIDLTQDQFEEYTNPGWTFEFKEELTV